MQEERVTVERGFAAYAKTGLIPRKLSWSGCGLAAVARAEGPEGVADRMFAWTEEVFGFRYKLGFMNGFDGGVAIYEDERSRLGQSDGRALREAVKPWMDAGLPVPSGPSGETTRPSEFSDDRELVTA